MNIVPISQSLVSQLAESGQEFPSGFDQAWQWIGYSTKANAKRNLYHKDAWQECHPAIKLPTGES